MPSPYDWEADELRGARQRRRDDRFRWLLLLALLAVFALAVVIAVRPSG